MKMGRKRTTAENKPSELIAQAITEGPQTNRPKDEAVVIVVEEDTRPQPSKSLTFRDWLFQGSRIDDLEILARDRSPMREATP
jgi:hypothetical protein